jgi:hypothetical protein
MRSICQGHELCKTLFVVFRQCQDMCIKLYKLIVICMSPWLKVPTGFLRVDVFEGDAGVFVATIPIIIVSDVDQTIRGISAPC